MEQRGGFAERIQQPVKYFYPDVDWETIENDLAENISLSRSIKIKYYEVPITFDIETTSFLYGDEQKAACMYAWVFTIYGYVILGRKWETVTEVYNKLVEMFQTSSDTRILVYIQNLSYEFQFIAKRFSWDKIFALDERKPLYALTTDGVEFRCSYRLSGYSLEKIGENLQKYKIKKLVGNLDYNKPRHYDTPLTEKEWEYIINDGLVVSAYIQETAENDGGYHKIPLTKTGYVRNYCRTECFKDKYYRRFMKELTLDVDEYKQLKRAFGGGFTHANWQWSRTITEDVDSFDFTSSYPYVMVSEMFPMSKAQIVDAQDPKQMAHYLKYYCCLFDIELTMVDGWEAPDHILSSSKCLILDNPVLDNGRVITADKVLTTFTEVDWESFTKFYKFEEYRVHTFRIYEKGYLPTRFVKAILQLYQKKTELKGVKGKEVEYLQSKEMINAAYGMSVTDIVRDEDTYMNDEWVSVKADPETAIEKYNKSPKRFLFYPWGVWVTSYARRNLFTGIYEFGQDYVYSDTDSIKVLNTDCHRNYIEEYNRIVNRKLELACEHHNVSLALTRPKTIKGIEKPLGVWDYEGRYEKFKTLGAKRYMVQEDGQINITVAGLNKEKAVPYILEESAKLGQTPFEFFDEMMKIPGEHTGKQTHTYNDHEVIFYLTDYLGVTREVHEYSSIHLGPAAYELSLNSGYLMLLRGEKFIKE